MNLKVFILLVLIFTLLFTLNCKKQAPADVLVPVNTLPLVDAAIGESEYHLTIETEKMILNLSRNKEKLAFGLSGNTLGWISIGFGAVGMDNSHIIIGYIGEDGSVVQEETGKGHSHSPADKQIVQNIMLTEKAGFSIFEGLVNARDIIKQDQEELHVIIACGSSDDFQSVRIQKGANCLHE